MEPTSDINDNRQPPLPPLEIQHVPERQPIANLFAAIEVQRQRYQLEERYRALQEAYNKEMGALHMQLMSYKRRTIGLCAENDRLNQAVWALSTKVDELIRHRDALQRENAQLSSQNSSLRARWR